MLIFLKSNLVIFWAYAQIRHPKLDTNLHFGLYYPLAGGSFCFSYAGGTFCFSYTDGTFCFSYVHHFDTEHLFSNITHNTKALNIQYI